MFGQKETLLFVVVTLFAVDAVKRNAQCDFVCQGKMTIECCECIGCHQGMRFGKRSSPVALELEPFAIEIPRVREDYAVPQWSAERFSMHPRQMYRPAEIIVE